MNLQPIQGTVFYFTCYCCKCKAASNGLPVRMGEPFEGPAMADLDGPAFKAYYCGHCAGVLQRSVTK